MIKIHAKAYQYLGEKEVTPDKPQTYLSSQRLQTSMNTK